jgi:L-cysteine/cystine lyase
LVIVDGAQAAGHVPVDLHALGVDVYAMAGQKWLCGPEGTGLLYIRSDRFDVIAPTYVRYGTVEASSFKPHAGAKRYELGELYSPAVEAQQAALRWLRDDVGLDWAYARIAQLGADFRRDLVAIDGVSVVTPANATAGLVNFTIAGLSPQEITAQLEERGYIIRYVDYPPCTVSARVSIGWWNTEEEVAGLLAAIAGIAAEARVTGG